MIRSVCIPTLSLQSNPPTQRTDCCVLQIRDGLFRPEMKTGQQYDPPVVLGFDAAGIVESVGSEVRKFKVADHVYYSGDPYRPGSFQEYQIVDERIVGKKPTTLSFEEAAALPLTSLTAWEAMHEVDNNHTDHAGSLPPTAAACLPHVIVHACD